MRAEWSDGVCTDHVELQVAEQSLCEQLAIVLTLEKLLLELLFIIK